MKTVQKKYGTIEGVQNCGYTVFWGTPYAAAPCRRPAVTSSSHVGKVGINHVST